MVEGTFKKKNTSSSEMGRVKKDGEETAKFECGEMIRNFTGEMATVWRLFSAASLKGVQSDNR